MKKKGWLLLMIILYVGAGIYHFINPDFYVSVMPDWLPKHELLVQISGIAEIVLGLLLIIPIMQQIAAWAITVMLVIFLVCIHIPMVLEFTTWDNMVWWIAVIRLPIQYVLFMWALRYTRGKIVHFFPGTDLP